MKNYAGRDHLPWLMPWESVECLEVMKEAAECIQGVAKFSGMRKELRDQLEEQARKLEECVKMYKRAIVDESLLIGLEQMAKDKNTVGGALTEIIEAVENHISQYNRRRT